MGARHTTTWNPTSTVVTVTHSGFAFTQTYAASATVQDSPANLMAAPYTWSFTTRKSTRRYLLFVVRNH